VTSSHWSLASTMYRPVIVALLALPFIFLD
jgi:hypothetical protein